MNYLKKTKIPKFFFIRKIPNIGYCLVLLITIYLLSILIVAWRPDPTLKNGA